MSFASAINNSLNFCEEYFNIFNKPLPLGKCFCVFHDNTHTPAAKVYGNVMHCFVCNRSYTVYDLLKKYNPLRLEEVKSQCVFDKSFDDESQKTPLLILNKKSTACQTMNLIVYNYAHRDRN